MHSESAYRHMSQKIYCATYIYTLDLYPLYTFSSKMGNLNIVYLSILLQKIKKKTPGVRFGKFLKISFEVLRAGVFWPEGLLPSSGTLFPYSISALWTMSLTSRCVDTPRRHSRMVGNQSAPDSSRSSSNTGCS